MPGYRVPFTSLTGTREPVTLKGVKITLPASEWQFRNIPLSEQWACHYYEYAREVRGIREAADEWRKPRAKARPPEAVISDLRTLPERIPLLKNSLLQRFVLECDAFPRTPWLDLPKQDRRYWSELIPEKDEKLQEPYDWLARLLPPNGPGPRADPRHLATSRAVAAWIDYFHRTGLLAPFPVAPETVTSEGPRPVPTVPTPTPEPSGEDWQRFFRNLGVVPFFIPEGMRSRNDLRAGFDLWLRDNPWAYSGRGDRRRLKKREPIEWLRRLAARRLQAAGPKRMGTDYRLSIGRYRSGWLQAETKHWWEWCREAEAYLSLLFGG